LLWSPWTGTGGRHQSEMLVAINRKPRSPCPGARTRARSLRIAALFGTIILTALA
jgi:hypothetical protein